jgi:hypothetical protein
MPDMTAITAGLTALKTASEIVKYLRTADKELEAAEYKLKLAELAESLADVKLQLIEAQDENYQLRQEIRTLKIKREFRSEIRLHENVYVAANGDISGYGNGPWCTNCFDSAGDLITLHHLTAGFVNDVTWYKWECPRCKSAVSAPDRK